MRGTSPKPGSETLVKPVNGGSVRRKPAPEARVLDRRRRLATVLTAFSVACAGNAESGSRSLADAPPAEFMETGRIGGFAAQGVLALGSVSAAALLPESDRLVVVDGSTQEIHYFTRGGEHVRTMGGRGGGPGESQALGQVWGRSDGGLCTWDMQQSRVSQFDSDGALVGTGRAVLDGMMSIRPAFVGFADDCSFVLRDGRDALDMRDEPEGMRQDTVRFVHFDSSGRPGGTILTRLGAERWFLNRDGGWGELVPIFGDELIALLVAGRLWVGPSSDLDWERVDVLTGVADRLRIGLNPRTASVSDVEAERSRRLAQLVEGEAARRRRVERAAAALSVGRTAGRGLAGDDVAGRMAERIRDGVSAVPARDLIPAYDEAVPGGDGTVWVREYPLAEAAEARWVMVDPNGSVAFQVVLPRDAVVLAATRNWLVVVEEDELEAARVRILRRADAG